MTINDFELNPRRPLDDDEPNGYLESDRDFVENNMDLAIWLLEHFNIIRETINSR